MADGDYQESWRFDVTLGLVFGAAAYAWHAFQGEYALGFGLFILLAVFLPPMMRFKAWLRRYRYRWLRRANAWAEAHPTASRRLRRVVFPFIGLLWALILWGLFA